LADGWNNRGERRACGGNPGASWHVKGAGDFNGNGKSDILWQNDNGQAAIWLMDGTTELSGAFVGGNPGPSWHVKGAEDFNGDGKSDIVWQNDNGQAQIWLLDGSSVLSGDLAGAIPAQRGTSIGRECPHGIFTADPDARTDGVLA